MFHTSTLEGLAGDKHFTETQHTAGTSALNK